MAGKILDRIDNFANKLGLDGFLLVMAIFCLAIFVVTGLLVWIGVISYDTVVNYFPIVIISALITHIFRH